MRVFLTGLFIFSIHGPTWLGAQPTVRAYVPSLIGFYNVENLFDTLDTPDVNDAEYVPTSAKLWGTERYQRKLERLASVIGDLGKQLHPQGLAILGLAEVENADVVRDLVATPPLKERKYKVVHKDGPDLRGIDVALIYDPERFKVLSHKSHRLRMEGKPDFLTRDQLLVTGILEGDTTHVIVAHWPSRRGGQKRSAPNRKAAAELGRHIIDSLLTAAPDARIIYMGDLNDDPVDPSVQRFMRTTGDKTKAVNGTFYNPMYVPYQKGIGTLAWRDAWNLFDQILLSPAFLSENRGNYTYYGVRIFNEAYLTQKEGNFAGYPFRTFVGDTYQDGFSDHFPVFVILVKEPD